MAIDLHVLCAPTTALLATITVLALIVMRYKTSDSLTQVPRDVWRSRDTLILVKLHVSPVHRFVRSVSHLLIAALATTVIFSDQITTATRLVCPGFSKM